MTRVDLDHAEDLHQSTTPGPWNARDYPAGTRVFAGQPEKMLVLARERTDAEFVVEAHRLWIAMCSELRAAREVVGAAQVLAHTTGFAAPEVYEERREVLVRALDAYDQAVSGA